MAPPQARRHQSVTVDLQQAAATAGPRPPAPHTAAVPQCVPCPKCFIIEVEADSEHDGAGIRRRLLSAGRQPWRPPRLGPPVRIVALK